MLLAPIDASLRLADVMPSCLAAIAGAENSLGLSTVTHAAVVLVDGMGAANLREHAGHARWLMQAWRAHGLSADVGFPSTTASALTTLTTGVSAGEHGIVGYSLREPASGQIINHLKDWAPLVELEVWQRSTTVFQRAKAQGIRSLSQGEPRFANTDFTKAVWRGAEFQGARSLEEQFHNARDFFDATPQGLAYLYWPALDRTGHGSGSESDSWLHRLEELDAQLAEYSGILGSTAGLVITADHGMIDVPDHDKMVIEAESPLLEGVSAWAGEPRAPQIYLSSAAKRDNLVKAWKQVVGDRAQVVTRDELIASGALGEVAPGVDKRLGDIVILCEGSLAIYHGPTASAQSQTMVGQHGSITPREREVPVILAGAWA